MSFINKLRKITREAEEKRQKKQTGEKSDREKAIDEHMKRREKWFKLCFEKETKILIDEIKSCFSDENLLKTAESFSSRNLLIYTCKYPTIIDYFGHIKKTFYATIGNMYPDSEFNLYIGEKCHKRPPGKYGPDAYLCRKLEVEW